MSKIILFEEETSEIVKKIIDKKLLENVEFFDISDSEKILLKKDNKNEYFIFSSVKMAFVTEKLYNLVDFCRKNKITDTIFNIILFEKGIEMGDIIFAWLKRIKNDFSLNFNISGEIDFDDIDNNLENIKNIVCGNENLESNDVVIYTDGACSGNPGAGGWGAVLIHGEKRKEISGFERETTNNRMELTAIIMALSALKKKCCVELFSDSAYAVNAINLGWLEGWKNNDWKNSEKQEVKNIDLWKRLDELINYHKVTFNKVKGHSDNELNNRCDELATGEIEKHTNLSEND